MNLEEALERVRELVKTDTTSCLEMAQACFHAGEAFAEAARTRPARSTHLLGEASLCYANAYHEASAAYGESGARDLALRAGARMGRRKESDGYVKFVDTLIMDPGVEEMLVQEFMPDIRYEDWRRWGAQSYEHNDLIDGLKLYLHARKGETLPEDVLGIVARDYAAAFNILSRQPGSILALKAGIGMLRHLDRLAMQENLPDRFFRYTEGFEDNAFLRRESVALPEPYQRRMLE